MSSFVEKLVSGFFDTKIIAVLLLILLVFFAYKILKSILAKAPQKIQVIARLIFLFLILACGIIIALWGRKQGFGKDGTDDNTPSTEELDDMPVDIDSEFYENNCDHKIYVYFDCVKVNGDVIEEEQLKQYIHSHVRSGIKMTIISNYGKNVDVQHICDLFEEEQVKVEILYEEGTE